MTNTSVEFLMEQARRSR